MDKNEHAFKELDFITTTFGSNVMRIEEVTDKGYRTDSREFHFISFLEESAFKKVNVGPQVIKNYQPGDKLSYNDIGGFIFNESQLDRIAKSRKCDVSLKEKGVIQFDNETSKE